MVRPRHRPADPKLLSPSTAHLPCLCPPAQQDFVRRVTRRNMACPLARCPASCGQLRQRLADSFGLACTQRVELNHEWDTSVAKGIIIM